MSRLYFPLIHLIFASLSPPDPPSLLTSVSGSLPLCFLYYFLSFSLLLSSFIYIFFIFYFLFFIIIFSIFTSSFYFVLFPFWFFFIFHYFSFCFLSTLFLSTLFQWFLVSFHFASSFIIISRGFSSTFHLFQLIHSVLARLLIHQNPITRFHST